MNNNILQRILWSIAGAEIPILEKCRTDHKKFGAMGATIAMTAFIAFLSGTSAAWFFTQRGTDTAGNLSWAMAFGLVWATLIFCIDRSLVITMKKNPSKMGTGWWIIPFISRALLALIIAFMVSIPLELVIFEDFIAEQSYIWNENKSNTLSQNSRANRASIETQKLIEEGTNNRDRLDGQKLELEKELSGLNKSLQAQQEKLNKPRTEAYDKAYINLRLANSNINRLRNEISTTEEDDDYKKRELTKQLTEWQKKRNESSSILKSEIAKWNEPINKAIAELKIKIQAKQEDIVKNKEDLSITESQIREEQARRASFIQQRDSLLEEHDATIREGNHFIQNFEILEYAVSQKDLDCHTCNGTGTVKQIDSKGLEDLKQCPVCLGSGHIEGEHPIEWYFLWLIRLLFFIIELLPTVVKIVMPIGAYDRMLLAEEKDMENYLLSPIYLDRIRKMHDLETAAHEEQLATQKEVEKDIRTKILEELKIAQLEIANAAVQKWRAEELKKIDNPKK